MQALWLENGRLSIRDDLPAPVPTAGEALVRLRLAGICGTDLELVRGYYPYTGIPGHEFVGEIVESSDGTPPGCRVVGEINVSCGECETCRRNLPTHCERRSVLGIRDRHGAFAGYLSLPLRNLHRVPDTVPDEAAVFTEPLAAALQIQRQITITGEHRVLLIGAGRLGQLIAQTLALTGCDLHVSARYPRQKALLLNRGIRVIAENEAPARRYDIVIEATGSPSGFELARRAVRPRGTLVLKSTYRDSANVNLSSLVVDEISLIGSRCGPFEAALNLLEQRTVDPVALIDAEFPLARSVEAFDSAAKSGVIKVLIRP
ncbi:MDR/zinc-dependent alcohol dehydrogenase-like family protein [Methylocaldum szegediense]|uniref:Threonine dehydrogenase-like Zn-dependent dehydrogenase n=1 Tax=Methylocaldum szegediense TaxID=73780 RepID=A0ABM9I5G1_9GAMM|nr:alcohol dehydrogenase catalytic domain-containing protein [Methylocaldum szegediense]CAI8903946.1 Threonine dehydrogenase-like Zn-dependent dehydrogenase [Methylocaldum szegediense]